MYAATQWCISDVETANKECCPVSPLPMQAHETGPELFVEVLGTLAVAADAACGSSNSDGAAGNEAAGSSGGGVAPWQLMRGVGVPDLLAFLVACFQQGTMARAHPPPWGRGGSFP